MRYEMIDERNGHRIQFFTATMDGVPVIGLREDAGTESETCWNAEVNMPINEEEARQCLEEFSWPTVYDTDNFREVSE